MSELKVDLLSKVSVAMALQILSSLVDDTGEEEVDMPDRLDDTGEEVGDDSLDELLGGEEVPFSPDITVEDMKDALKALMTAKGKDVALALVNKAFAKMNVKKMDSIPEEKRESFVNILRASTK